VLPDDLTAAVGAVSSGFGMFQAFLMQRAMAVVTALVGGFGVFCVVYSFTAPDIAAQGLILLGLALAMSYFSSRG
jgi:tryptophan synthase beta subunit